MKTLTKILAACTALALLAGCVNEEPPYKGKTDPAEPSPMIGYLAGTLDLHVIYDSETDTRPDDTEDETQRPSAASARTRTAPNTSGYTVEIFDSEEVSVLKTTYGELTASLQSEPLPLPVGTYRMEVTSTDPAALDAVAWETPVYGTSYAFAILKDKTTTIDKIVCTLQNIKVTLMWAADLKGQLKPETRAILSIGSVKADFTQDETRAAYFLPQAEENTLELKLEGEFIEGGPANFSKRITGVKAGQWRKIKLVIDYADKGNGAIDIEVENFVLDETITVNGTENLWEPLYEEQPLVEAPTLAWSGHNFAEPFQLKASLFDADNLCSEPFEIVAAAPGRIASFEVAISSTSEEFLNSLDLAGIPRTFDLCTVAGAPAALLQGFGFPVGSDVLDASEKTFRIGGQLPWLLYGYDGTHTFSFAVTDREEQTARASLVLKVDRSNEADGPTIVMQGHDIAQPYVLETVEDIRVDIAAPNGGIRSLMVKIESDALAPMLASAPRLLDWFDLCTIDGEEADFLKTVVGFPVGSEVQDKTTSFFVIDATFIGILQSLDPEVAGEPNTYRFRLEVTDNSGATTQAVLTMVQPSTPR